MLEDAGQCGDWGCPGVLYLGDHPILSLLSMLNFTNVVPYLGTCTLSPGYKKQIVDPIIFEPGEMVTDSRGLR